MRLEPCRITTVSAATLNGRDRAVMLVDGEIIATGTKKDLENFFDFFHHGYSSKKLSGTQKNHIMQVLERFPYLRLYGCHSVTGEPLLDDPPIRRGKRYWVDYENTILYHVYEEEN